MTEHSVVHGDFSLTRNLKAPVSKVYQAFADKTAKEQWFGEPPGSSDIEHTMDFKVGGSEYNSGKFHDGVTHVFKAKYYDIVPEQRIIYTYEMYLDGQRISVSLATIEFAAKGQTTELTLSETGVFLNGLDAPESRERGTKDLLVALEAAVTKQGE